MLCSDDLQTLLVVGALVGAFLGRTRLLNLGNGKASSAGGMWVGDWGGGEGDLVAPLRGGEDEVRAGEGRRDGSLG